MGGSGVGDVGRHGTTLKRAGIEMLAAWGSLGIGGLGFGSSNPHWGDEDSMRLVKPRLRVSLLDQGQGGQWG